MVILATKSRMDSKIWLTALATKLVKSASDKKLLWGLVGHTTIETGFDGDRLT